MKGILEFNLRNQNYQGYLKPYFTEEENLSTDLQTKLNSQTGLRGAKPCMKSAGNSSDDILMNGDSLPRSIPAPPTMAKSQCNPQLLAKCARTSSSAKKARGRVGFQSSRSAGSSDQKRKNPVLRRIIESLKDKIADSKVEEKIYSYLDFIDKNGAPSTIFVSKSHADIRKAKKSKKAKRVTDMTRSKDFSNEIAPRSAMIEQKMNEFKERLHLFTEAFKEQRLENEKMKEFIAFVIKEQQQGSSSDVPKV